MFGGSQFETFWHQFSQKMRLEQIMKKVCKTSDATKNGWRAKVPLKEGKSDKRHQTADNGLEHALACLAARWRIKRERERDVNNHLHPTHPWLHTQ